MRGRLKSGFDEVRWIDRLPKVRSVTGWSNYTAAQQRAQLTKQSRDRQSTELRRLNPSVKV